MENPGGHELVWPPPPFNTSVFALRRQKLSISLSNALSPAKAVSGRADHLILTTTWTAAEGKSEDGLHYILLLLRWLHLDIPPNSERRGQKIFEIAFLVTLLPSFITVGRPTDGRIPLHTLPSCNKSAGSSSCGCRSADCRRTPCSGWERTSRLGLGEGLLLPLLRYLLDYLSCFLDDGRAL